MKAPRCTFIGAAANHGELLEPLPEREREVLALMADGTTGLPLKTPEDYPVRLLRLLNVQDHRGSARVIGLAL